MNKVTSLPKEKKKEERGSCPPIAKNLWSSFLVRGKLGHFTKLEPPHHHHNTASVFAKKAKVFMLKTFLNTSA